jgi:hypothetical protein
VGRGRRTLFRRLDPVFVRFSFLGRVGYTYTEEHHEGLERCDPCNCAGGVLAQLVAFIVCLEDSNAWFRLEFCVLLRWAWLTVDPAKADE